MAQESTTQISNKYSEYIAKLPGVINANVVFESDEVEEIHVLADMSRSPKQIVRDVQSLLMAQFQKEIDHRVVSVAQIDYDMLPTIAKPLPRLVIEAVTVAKRREFTEVEVTLSSNGKMFLGKKSALKDNYDLYRGIAQATLSAVVISCDLPQAYTVLEVRFIEIAGGRLAIVCVSLSSPNNNAGYRFSGTAFSLEDDALAVVKATLSAVNRRIGSC